MNDQNPYSAPDASLETGQQEFYQPKIFSFKGRIGRLRYIAYGMGTYLAIMAVFMPFMGGTMLLGGSMELAGETVMPIAVIVGLSVFYIAIIVLSVAFGKRRLNDLNRSGWWMLIFIVPLVNLFMAIYIVFFPGSNEANDFGAPPTANSLGVKILGSIFPLIFLLGIVAAIAIPAYQEYISAAG
jgi:uncharacterized membrane protein YhaH (DUF805 family)